QKRGYRLTSATHQKILRPLRGGTTSGYLAFGAENRNGKSRNERISIKLGFISLDLPGHLNPMSALARQLQARNHEVVFLYSSGAAGLPFVPSPEKDHINENRPEASKKQGEDALQFSVRAVLAQTEAILKSLPAIVKANGIDALLIDTVKF